MKELNEKNVTDKKYSPLSEKIETSEKKFYLVNREELIDTDIHIAQLLNSFSNVAKKLKITNIKTVTLSHLISSNFIYSSFKLDH